jgi:DNA-binding transcriptional LysR family regulator
MDTKKLEALAAAVEHGSFTRAAEALGYTQSGMTHMMNSLERDIGFPVLLRGRAGVRLTPAGERIYPLVRQVLSASQALDREIAPLEIASWSHPKGGYFISFDARYFTRRISFSSCPPR